MLTRCSHPLHLNLCAFASLREIFSVPGTLCLCGGYRRRLGRETF
jgi:hypothetical protein